MAEETAAPEGTERAAAEGPPPRLRLSRRGTAVVGALGALAAGGCVWLVFFSPVLDVRAVAVTGTAKLTPDQVAAAAGVDPGGPLARVDTDAVRRRITGRLRRVDRVEVWRGWPHTLRIKVVERRPVAAVAEADGRFTEVDAAGVRFATGPAAPPGVPVVRLVLDQAARDADAVIPQRELVAAAVRVAGDLPPAVAGKAAAVEVHSYDDIELRLDGGRTVRWGSSERGPRKARVLTALLGHRARTYDVSAPEAPATAG
ncbi:FtsQ-type POTRA domain-containing protein [Streptacidiphilus sp. ASG 303]|uniref:cell division protein FtsQ/DivIB n=1 Tax=Streptacidiphilus sp. ASG 303 TaxID=2896847 RepID=UPI001E53EDF4|nr:FtsQ-type POTRA domain-containing protein [Streptacidiphilus sp. ASG 303]MCD0481627.1 FtsQ-type POTRA domain-containing protein [Streptacidiphilus sp. ASG 303]